MEPLLAPLALGWGESEKSKSEGTPGLRSRQFNRENRSPTCKENKGIASPFPMDGQGLAIPGQQGSLTGHGDLGRVLGSPNVSCFLLPPAFHTEHDATGLEYPLDQLCSAGCQCPIPNPCAPQPLCWWSGVRTQKGLGCVSPAQQ